MSDNKPKEDSAKFRFKKVRASFPNLFKARSFEEGKEGRFGIRLLLDKVGDAEQITAFKAHLAKIRKAKWGDNPPKGIKVCLHDGIEKEDTEGYGPKVMFVNTSSPRKPMVVDRDKSPLSSEDGKPYAGCYVNANVRVWAQDNKYGKKLNAQIQSVQFVADGKAFGAAPLDPDDEFDAVPEDESAPKSARAAASDIDEDDDEENDPLA